MIQFTPSSFSQRIPSHPISYSTHLLSPRPNPSPSTPVDLQRHTLHPFATFSSRDRPRPLTLSGYQAPVHDPRFRPPEHPFSTSSQLQTSPLHIYRSNLRPAMFQRLMFAARTHRSGSPFLCLHPRPVPRPRGRERACRAGDTR